MQHFQILMQTYESSLHCLATQRSAILQAEFKMLIEGMRKMDATTLPRLRYSSEHANFLMETISHPQKSESLKFTLLIQLLNLLLRTEGKAKLQVPINLMDALKHHLTRDPAYLRSPAVVSNIVWLVGRCVQMARDRAAAMARLSASQLLQCCLQAEQLQPLAQRGISLLLTYMSKLSLINEQCTLKLLDSLDKFRSQQSVRQLMVVLSRIDVRKLIGEEVVLEKVKCFSISYIHDDNIPWQQKCSHWQFFASLCYFDKTLINQLLLDDIFKVKVAQNSLTIAPHIYDMVCQISSIVVASTHQAQTYLRLSSPHLVENLLARRIFIQHHDKMDPQLFTDLLSGSLPGRLKEALSNQQQKAISLKLLICLKRSAALLGLNRFFEFKFKGLRGQIERQGKDGASCRDLLDLWKDVQITDMEKYL